MRRATGLNGDLSKRTALPDPKSLDDPQNLHPHRDHPQKQRDGCERQSFFCNCANHNTLPRHHEHRENIVLLMFLSQGAAGPPAGIVAVTVNRDQTQNVPCRLQELRALGSVWDQRVGSIADRQKTWPGSMFNHAMDSAEA
jgi:hypothetical protein